MMIDRLFRVFVSSTFADFEEERRALDERVFPELSAYCQKRGFRFQAIDLRWGVANEAALEQNTLPICLAEVQRCISVSPRPCLVALVGQRYGWRPLPTSIEQPLVERIRPALARADLFDRWYQHDTNAVPVTWVLLPRDPAGVYADPLAWSAEEEALRQDLVQGAAASAPEYLPDLMRSATEHELRCFMAQAHLSAKAVAYRRTVTASGTADLPIRFIDTTEGGAPDEDARERVEALWHDLEQHPHVAVHQLKARADNSQISEDYLEAFASLVRQNLEQAIGDEIARFEGEDPVASEIRSHERYLEGRTSSFVGREHLVATTLAHLADPARNAPLVITGPGGIGKSSLVAKVLERHTDSGHRVVRFVGATPQSTGSAELLQGIVAELQRLYPSDEVEDAQLNDAAEQFRTLLQRAAPDAPLLLVIDALDQLGGALPSWVPVRLPPHVDILYSLLPGPALEALRLALPTDVFIDVPPLSHNETVQLLGQRLLAARRTLTPAQLEMALNATQQEGSPLYVTLAAAEAATWRSFDTPAPLPASVALLVERMVARHARVHGASISSAVFRLIALSSAGVSEVELHEILSSDETVLSEFRVRSPNSPPTQGLPVVVLVRLLDDIAPVLSRSSADGEILLQFSHRLVGEIIRASTGPDERSRIHGMLADYFDAKPNWRDEELARAGAPVATLRKASQLWFHLLELGDGARIVDRMLDFDFLMAVCAVRSAPQVVDAYDAAVSRSDDPTVAAWRDFLVDSLSLLLRGNASWPAHKILLQAAADAPVASPVAAACEEWLASGRCGWNWWRRNRRASASATRGHLHGVSYKATILPASEGSFLGWGDSITAKTQADAVVCRWNADGRLITRYVGMPKGVAAVVELAGGGIAARDRGHVLALWRRDGALVELRRLPRVILGMRPMPDGNLVVWSRDGRIRIIQPTGEEIANLDGPTEKAFELDLIDGAILAWERGGSTRFYGRGLEPVEMRGRISAVAVLSAAYALLGTDDGWLELVSDTGAVLEGKNLGFSIKTLSGIPGVNATDNHATNRQWEEEGSRAGLQHSHGEAAIVNAGRLFHWQRGRELIPIGEAKAGFVPTGELVSWGPGVYRWKHDCPELVHAEGAITAILRDGSLIINLGDKDNCELVRCDRAGNIAPWPKDFAATGLSRRSISIMPVDDDVVLVGGGTKHCIACSNEGLILETVGGFAATTSSLYWTPLSDGRVLLSDFDGNMRIWTLGGDATADPSEDETAPLCDRLYRLDDDRICTLSEAVARFCDAEGAVRGVVSGLRPYVHTADFAMVHSSGHFIIDDEAKRILVCDRDGRIAAALETAPYTADDAQSFAIYETEDRSLFAHMIDKQGMIILRCRFDEAAWPPVRFDDVCRLNRSVNRLVKLEGSGFAANAFAYSQTDHNGELYLFDDHLNVRKTHPLPACSPLTLLAGGRLGVASITTGFVFDDDGKCLDQWKLVPRADAVAVENFRADERLRPYRRAEQILDAEREISITDADDDRRKIRIVNNRSGEITYWHSQQVFGGINRTISAGYLSDVINPTRIACIVRKRLTILARMEGATRVDVEAGAHADASAQATAADYAASGAEGNVPTSQQANRISSDEGASGEGMAMLVQGKPSDQALPASGLLSRIMTLFQRTPRR